MDTNLGVTPVFPVSTGAITQERLYKNTVSEGDRSLMIHFDTTPPAFHAPAGSHFSTIRISHHGLREKTPADDDAGEHAVKTDVDIRSGLLRRRKRTHPGGSRHRRWRANKLGPSRKKIKPLNQRLTVTTIWRPQGDSNPCYRRERAVS